MRIRKFSESEVIDISPERIQEIKKYLLDLVNDVNQESENVDSILNELGNFKSSSKSNNDQIDDSIANLQMIRKSLKDAVDKVDTVVNNLKDYDENGRKYLY